MEHQREKKYEGRSQKSFADAAQKAFDRYKEEVLKGRQAPDRITFRVSEMYVTASNPIHDFIIELEQVQP
jgi:hypothetical protein